MAGMALAAPLRSQTSPPAEPRLGGLLPLDQAALASWCWCGAWEFPVGIR
jgi:hypothetical protein